MLGARLVSLHRRRLIEYTARSLVVPLSQGLNGGNLVIIKELLEDIRNLFWLQVLLTDMQTVTVQLLLLETHVFLNEFLTDIVGSNYLAATVRTML